MSEKIFTLRDSELQYVAKVSDSKIKLSYSDSEIWTSHTKGQKIGTLKDNGDEVTLKMGDIDLKLQYDTLFELYTLLELKIINDGEQKSSYLKKSELNFLEINEN